jgi:hypothetical protein
MYSLIEVLAEVVYDCHDVQRNGITLVDLGDDRKI